MALNRDKKLREAILELANSIGQHGADRQLGGDTVERNAIDEIILQLDEINAGVII